MLVKYTGFKENYKYTDKYDFSKGTCEMPNNLAVKLIDENSGSFVQVKPKVVNITKKQVTASAKGAVAGSKAAVKPEAA